MNGSTRRRIALAVLPIAMVALMGAKGGCSTKSGGTPASTPAPVTAPSMAVPSDAVQLPAPMADKAPYGHLPAPPPPPFHCTSWLDYGSIGARVGKDRRIHVAVNAWCYAPPTSFELIIVLFKYNDHGTPIPVPGGSSITESKPFSFPSWAHYEYSVSCTPGKYAVSQHVSGIGSDGKTPYEAGPAHGDYLYVEAGEC